MSSGKEVLAQLEKNIDREITKGKINLLAKLNGHMRITMPKSPVPDKYLTVCQCGHVMTTQYDVFLHHYQVLTEGENK